MWAVSDFIKGSWDEIIYFRSFGTLVRISRICEEDSFASSQWRKIFAALRTKGWSNILLTIRLLFIAPVKLERMFSKLKLVKINFRCSLSKVWEILWKLWKRVAVRKLFTQYQQQRSGALIKLGAQTRRKDRVASSHVILLKWMLNLSVMMTVKMRRIVFLTMGTQNVFFWLLVK